MTRVKQHQMLSILKKLFSVDGKIPWIQIILSIILGAGGAMIYARFAKPAFILGEGLPFRKTLREAPKETPQVQNSPQPSTEPNQQSSVQPQTVPTPVPAPPQQTTQSLQPTPLPTQQSIQPIQPTIQPTIQQSTSSQAQLNQLQAIHTYAQQQGTPITQVQPGSLTELADDESEYEDEYGAQEYSTTIQQPSYSQQM